MRVISIGQFPEEHFPQIYLVDIAIRPRNYIAINHNIDEKDNHAYSSEEIAQFARENFANFKNDNVEYFALVFGKPGVKPSIFQIHEIENALKNPEYGQCPIEKISCQRKNLCPVASQC